MKKKNMSVPTNGKSGCNLSSRLHNPGIRPLLRLRQRHRLDETNPAPVEVGASSRSAADRDFSPPIPPECPHPDAKSLYPQRLSSICLGTCGLGTCGYTICRVLFVWEEAMKQRNFGELARLVGRKFFLPDKMFSVHLLPHHH